MPTTQQHLSLRAACKRLRLVEGESPAVGVVLQVHVATFMFVLPPPSRRRQVVPGGDGGEGYRLRFVCEINVKLPSNV